MKIIVIGANGQLGSDCCNILSAENETVGCDIPNINIGNKSSVDKYLEETRPDVIVNCAAYTAVDACEREVELSWRVNADGPRHIAQAAERIGCRLIHISTDYVFDGNRPAPQPYCETDTPNPLSQYGKSKLAGEQAVAAYASNHVIIRTAWLYSAKGKNFLKTILKLAASDPTRELKVVDDQFGSLTWSYTLALQIQKLLHSDLTGIFHATSEGHSSWYQAARYFLDSLGLTYTMIPCTTAEYPTQAPRPANSILENRVLKAAGISTFISWQEDIDIFVGRHGEELLKEAEN